jgi:hypothetical protein
MNYLKGDVMKRYKLLKDTPTIKAGAVFKEVVSDFDELKELIRITPIGAKTNPQWTIQDIDDFDEWFEEIQEPTDSIRWKPVIGDEYWSFRSDGGISHNFCTGGYWDTARYEMGRTYRTKKECEKARDRELAEVRLRRTSTFKPDFENDNGGWVVYYDPREKRLEVQEVYRLEYGELVRYETEEEAERSIKENREDWRIYFGIKEGE